jgi:hypothetical protein
VYAADGGGGGAKPAGGVGGVRESDDSEGVRARWFMVVGRRVSTSFIHLVFGRQDPVLE